MAGSDNVLRAGLTPKHVDMPELLSIASFEPGEPGEPDVIEPVRHSGEDVYVTMAPEFRLSRLDAAEHLVLPASGPQLLLCAEGEVHIRRGAEGLDLRRGNAIFAGHDGGPMEVEGTGTLLCTSLPMSVTSLP